MGGMPDVEDGDVGEDAPDHVEQRFGVAGLTGDVEPGRGEKFDQSGPQQGMVLGYDDAHGRSISKWVPAPGGLSTCMVPPTAATRSAMPRSPVPWPASAPPSPSSVTSIRIARSEFDGA